MKVIRNITKNIVFVINILVSIMFLLSSAAIYVSPEFSIVPAYFGLAFPYLALANIGFAFFWFWQLKSQFLLSTIVAFAGFGQYFNIVQLSFEKQKDTEKNFHILSHNLRAFGLNGPKFETSTGRKIFKFYRDHRADIFCFQEFFDTQNNNFAPLDSMRKMMKTEYEHIKYSVHFRGNKFGLATFSKYPIVDTGTVNMPGQGTNMCIYSDIKIGTLVYRIYNMHLASIHFKEEEYKYIETIAEQTNEGHVKGATNLMSKISNAFEKRAIQAEIIAKHISKSPYPVVICGDFNDMPYSYTYGVLAKNKVDAFQYKGNGFGATYNGKIPNLRIDYILLPENTDVFKFKIFKEDLSDHYPQMATVRFK